MTLARHNLNELKPDANNVDPLNTNLLYLDAASNAWHLVSMSTSAPPGSPAEGDTYLVPDSATATGAWAGMEANFATYYGGRWWFVPVRVGDLLWVEDEGNGLGYRVRTVSPTLRFESVMNAQHSTLSVVPINTARYALLHVPPKAIATSAGASPGVFIRTMRSVVFGTSSPSVSWVLETGTSYGVADATLLSGQTSDSTTGKNHAAGGLLCPAVASNRYVWVRINGALGGTVTGWSLMIEFALR